MARDGRHIAGTSGGGTGDVFTCSGRTAYLDSRGGGRAADRSGCLTSSQRPSVLSQPKWGGRSGSGCWPAVARRAVHGRRATT